MILNLLIAVAVILGLLAGWIGIQHLGRSFAQRHPEFGPAREEGGGCGFFCLCKGPEACPRRAQAKGIRPMFIDESDSSMNIDLTPSHPFEKTHPRNQESKS